MIDIAKSFESKKLALLGYRVLTHCEESCTADVQQAPPRQYISSTLPRLSIYEDREQPHGLVSSETTVGLDLFSAEIRLGDQSHNLLPAAQFTSGHEIYEPFQVRTKKKGE